MKYMPMKQTANSTGLFLFYSNMFIDRDYAVFVFHDMNLTLFMLNIKLV